MSFIPLFLKGLGATTWDQVGLPWARGNTMPKAEKGRSRHWLRGGEGHHVLGEFFGL